MKHLLLLGSVLLLAACMVAKTSTPLPTQQAISLIFPMDLKPWADKLGACAAQDPRSALYFQLASSDTSQPTSNEIVLALGNPAPGSAKVSATQPGWERIEVVVNQENELTEISLKQLDSIYTGQIVSWENQNRQPIQVWVLPDDSPTRTAFDQAVFPNQRLAPEAMLAPDPSAMLEAIAQDANAIGYLPGSYLKSGDQAQLERVKKLPLAGLSQDVMQIPVIALTLGEPQGVLRQLLLCLQADLP